MIGGIDAATGAYNDYGCPLPAGALEHCVTHPGHRYLPGTQDRLRCSFCLPGYGSNSSQTGIVWPPSSPASPNCTACAAGSFATGTTPGKALASCTPCAIGQFANESGSVHCEACRAGRFADKTGMAVCSGSSCPAGSEAPAGATDGHTCSACKAGTFSHGGSNACASCGCPAGEGSAIANASQCNCANCTAGFHSQGGADQCAACTCKPGHGSATRGASNPSTTCTECPAGSAGTGGAAQCENCTAGLISDAGAAKCHPPPTPPTPPPPPSPSGALGGKQSIVLYACAAAGSALVAAVLLFAVRKKRQAHARQGEKRSGDDHYHEHDDQGDMRARGQVQHANASAQPLSQMMYDDTSVQPPSQMMYDDTSAQPPSQVMYDGSNASQVMFDGETSAQPPSTLGTSADLMMTSLPAAPTGGPRCFLCQAAMRSETECGGAGCGATVSQIGSSDVAKYHVGQTLPGNNTQKGGTIAEVNADSGGGSGPGKIVVFRRPQEAPGARRQTSELARDARADPKGLVGKRVAVEMEETKGVNTRHGLVIGTRSSLGSSTQHTIRFDDSGDGTENVLLRKSAEQRTGLAFYLVD